MEILTKDNVMATELKNNMSKNRKIIDCRISDKEGCNGGKYLQAFVNGVEIDGIVSIKASCEIHEKNTVQIIAHCNLENKGNQNEES